MNARTRFRQWLDSEITPTLAAAGYVRRGHHYERSTSDTLLMVAFQVARSSAADEVEFNVYGGVCSFRLSEFDSARVKRSPRKWIDLIDCQVQIPLFFLLGERVERWWSIDLGSMQEMGAQFRSWITSLLIPELEARQTDVALRDEYLRQRSAQELGPVGLGHLLCLLRAIGPPSDISGVEQELVGASERRLARNLEIMAQERVDP
jgi:hypothetical protein